MRVTERVARLVIAGALFGIVICAIRGDFWSTIVVEGALWVVVIGGVWVCVELVRRFANRNVKPS